MLSLHMWGLVLWSCICEVRCSSTVYVGLCHWMDGMGGCVTGWRIWGPCHWMEDMGGCVLGCVADRVGLQRHRAGSPGGTGRRPGVRSWLSLPGRALALAGGPGVRSWLSAPGREGHLPVALLGQGHPPGGGGGGCSLVIVSVWSGGKCRRVWDDPGPSVLPSGIGLPLVLRMILSREGRPSWSRASIGFPKHSVCRWVSSNSFFRETLLVGT